MDYEQIRYEVADGILTITLDRPEKLNAFTGRMMRELIDAFDRADADDAVRAIIVTGAGRALLRRRRPVGRAAARSTTRGSTALDDATATAAACVTLRIFESKKPVIAAINGPAVGVGVTMTLPMDVRIASIGGAHRLRLRAPRHRARGVLELVPAAARRHQPSRRVGATPAASSPPRRRSPARLGEPRRRTRGAARHRARAGARDRRQHVGDVGHALASAALAHARRRPPDGGAQGRLAVHLLDGSLAPTRARA